MSAQMAIGIDIGGSSLKAAVVDTHMGTLSSPIVTAATPKPAPPDRLMAVLRDLLASFDTNLPLGIGFPGIVKDERIKLAVHLSPDWLDLDARALFCATLQRPVSVLNDADAAGCAEMRFGAGKPRNAAGGGVVLFVAFGTGIGTALFVDGVLVPNTEFGHLYLEGLEAESLAAASVRARLGLDWPLWGARVSRYLQHLEMLLSPDLIVIGGGVSEQFSRFAPFLSLRARVEQAALGPHAGVIGAACHAMTREKAT